MNQLEAATARIVSKLRAGCTFEILRALKNIKKALITM
jgi:hypothetical protein